ncbi:XRE family transcriptional regulator [Clostridium botulinum]|nr:XRE family transcriptional regulator [Clostridium botulinum]
MSIFKKDLLFKMIEEGQIKSFTILGLPKQELVETYFNRKDLIKFLESKNIKCNILDEFDRTDIGIYFPSVGRKQYVDVCSITINKEVDEGEYNNILALFDEVLGYYQTDIPAKIINKILGLYKDEPLIFNDMLILMKDNQSEIARKINKSRQLIADMKSGKAKIGIETLALLKREYPLLPWGEFIESFVNN